MLSVITIAVWYKKHAKDIRLIILLIILSLVFTFGYKYILIVGDSMDPSNKNLQVVMIDKLSYDFEPPKRGDVIVFYDYEDNDFLIKRVVGMPGETVQIIDGWIYIDERLCVDKFSDIIITDASGIYGLNVSPDFLKEKEYWVIGDNRNESWYGVIHEDQIVGQHYE